MANHEAIVICHVLGLYHQPTALLPFLVRFTTLPSPGLRLPLPLFNLGFLLILPGNLTAGENVALELRPLNEDVTKVVRAVHEQVRGLLSFLATI